MAIESLAQLDARLSGRPESNDEEGQMQQQHPLVAALSKVPGTAWDTAKELPGNLLTMASQVPGSLKKIVTDPINAGRDVAGSFARLGQNTAAYLGEGGQELASLLTGGYAPRVNIREELGLGQKNPMNLGAMIESNNPDPLLSGAANIMSATSLGKKIPGLIAGSAMTGAINAPEGQRIQGATQGAVNAALPIGAGKLVAKGYNVARPSNLLRGNLSPEELQANLEAAQGTNTNLGDVIGSPTLKRIYENVLPNVPLSGAFTKMQETANQITGQGQDLMANIGKNLPEGDKTKILQDALQKASQEATQEKNTNYQKVNKIADESGLMVGRGKFQSKAQQILDDIAQSPELVREFPADFKADLESYATNDKGNSLKLSNIFKGKLNDKANEFYSSGKMHEYGLMKDLKNALGEDIESTIKDSGNDKLKSAFDIAQKEYGTKFAPFEDPDIVKFTRQGGDADLMLSHFLKGGSNDRGNLLQKLTTKLPEDLRELPLHMYLSKAIDESGRLNPPKFRTLYKNLGEKQREALIPDEAMRKQLDKYSRTVGLNSDTFNTMFNPKTGQRNLDSTIGAIEGMMAYNHPVKAAASIALGRGATKLLTSEKMREGLVKAMLKAKK